ncbi:glutathionylspermidine synthase family protein [uncultured Alsobacter sp.]|uniref:glutathionylspermidine synthase family protein n=1 Tax=uncultured Alsobacter sp. TaxID=1748258 RepID=UPI0025EA3E37|nr:glutathionylspermidine synthase family protein [uncultured Alsobacter sp.]
MRRVAIAERADWKAMLEADGFDFHTINDAPYWVEDAYYAFTLAQIENHIEDVTTELEAMCRDLAGRIVGDERLLRRLAIPETAWDPIAASWRRDDPSLYGRFDFAYDGTGPAKLLEYNADTPTALFETGYVQWRWLEDARADGRLPPEADQFNSVHDKLVAALARITGGRRLHLTCMDDTAEDRGTVAYLEECARQAGGEAVFVRLADIGRSADDAFVDDKDRLIAQLFKLYPWEWMLRDDFAAALPATVTRFIEPPWKAVISNKGLLPLLWEAYPGHPALLPAFFENDPRKATLGTSFARKPLYSREGANVTLVRDAQVLDADPGPYGREGYVRQALAPIVGEAGRYVVLGSWVVAGEAAGLCLREDDGPITKNTSRFLPHAILG